MAALYPPQASTFHKALEAISSLRPGERSTLSGLFGSSKAFFIATLLNSQPSTLNSILIITPDQEGAEGFAKDLDLFLHAKHDHGEGNTILYPSWELLPFEAQSPHPDIEAAGIGVLYKLLEGHAERGGQPLVVVTTPSALMQRVIPPEVLRSSVEYLEVGKAIDRDRLVEDLLNRGYSRMAMVEERGELSVRGGILDIFPPLYPQPIRLEFFGDWVESIRAFDPSSQRSKGDIKAITILPASELSFDGERKAFALKGIRERADELGLSSVVREELSERVRGGLIFSGMEFLLPLFYPSLNTFFDYLPKETILFLNEPMKVEEEVERFGQEVREMEVKLRDRRQFFVRPEALYLSKEGFLTHLKAFSAVHLNGLGLPGALQLPAESNMDIRQDIALRKEELLKPLVDRVKTWQDLGWRVFLVCHTSGQSERLKELLEGYNLSPHLQGGGRWPLDASYHCPVTTVRNPEIIVGELGTGFRIPSINLAVITEEDIFGERVKRRPPTPRKMDAFLTQLRDLEVGDLVVHTDHGIGVYQGLKRLKIEGIENDYLMLEYQGGDRLYLPVHRLSLIGKYIGVEGKRPPINRLGGSSWQNTRKRVKRAVEEIARELLQLYAERQVKEGFAFSRGDRLFSEFEASFEYDETPDQAMAIEDVMRDMEEAKPMDRLICGDVGYGKTEVAMRAAFKAVLDSKQVALLVPTTVLAQQHYLTFKKRFAPYPVIVEVLSRFKGPEEQRGILKRLTWGEIDIIIGTHRLLQKDVAFKDLGLVIIDEEHRFGVTHKERLKEMRKTVDVLTLTATPIPRTLHMSLAGIRDLSIINTPPEDRLAIKTVIARFDESIIRDAVLREIARGGQVFFVHNRVQSIGVMERFLNGVVPEARIAVAHGQMAEKVLEKVMSAFVNNEYNLLLTTAIIGSGLDIPSANTIIINRTDRFGLADLYQLRGRVGRSHHRAYAYLLIPPESHLTEDARKRIKVLQEFSDLGSGFRIATYDLEIRGAGELLGHAQSGHIADVGFDMYTRLLEEAVKELRGEGVEEEIEPEIDLKVPAFIPEGYIQDTNQRLNIYKRLTSAHSQEEVEDIKRGLQDRFGEIPLLVDNLLEVIRIRLMLRRIRATHLSIKGNRLTLVFARDTRVLPEEIVALVAKDTKLRVTPEGRLIYTLDGKGSIWEEVRGLLHRLI